MVTAGHGWSALAAVHECEDWEVSGVTIGEVLLLGTEMHQLRELGTLEVVACSREAQANVWCPLVCGSAGGYS